MNGLQVTAYRARWGTHYEVEMTDPRVLGSFFSVTLTEDGPDIYAYCATCHGDACPHAAAARRYHAKSTAAPALAVSEGER